MVGMSIGDLNQLREVTRLPRWPANATPADQISLLQAESAVRDLVVVFGYAMNSGDIHEVMSFYADDCTLINPRGKYVGHDAIHANYLRYFQLFPWVRHVWANIGLRFPSSLDEAYLTAYQYAVALDTPIHELDRRGMDNTLASSALSTDVWRLERRRDGWKIAARTIHYDPRLYYRLALFEME